MSETAIKSYKPKIRLQISDGYRFVNEVVKKK